jgi:hypothetical protein
MTVLKGSGIYVRFNLLETVGESHNPLYLFPRRARVVMQGVTWEVGLYRHALEQLSARLAQHVKPSYARWVEVDSMFIEL